MLESSLTKALQRHVKGRDGWVRKIHQGRTGAGFPDLVVGYRSVSMFWEVKVPGNKVTRLQEETMKEMKKAGMLAFVVESVEQARAILDKIDERRDRAKRRTRKKST